MRDFFADIDWSRWSETIWTHGARVIIVAAVIYIALRIVRRALDPTIRTLVQSQMAGEPASEVQKRVDTLSHAIYRAIAVIAAFAGLMTILPEFGINIGALLAGAGIIGLAIGFGTQSLVRDIVSGFFILVENPYAKGDTVRIAEVSGVVQDINLRRTILRDADGTMHSVPNGEVSVASNLSRGRQAASPPT